MAQPARTPPAVEEPLLVDPAEIERAYRHHRARRQGLGNDDRQFLGADVAFHEILFHEGVVGPGELSPREQQVHESQASADAT